MQLTIEEMPNGITKAMLDGRLDIEGAAAVDMRLNVLAGSAGKLLIDVSKVSFLASMGLRTLMTCARATKSKGRVMAIAGPQPNVDKVMRSSGLDEVVDIYETADAAVAALST
ncbi:MAG: STAS domain-containing protein [Hyphomicrobiaceae bacterium]|nr:STAS domain-containing protein [Hyphomicrobiaceae bacterium]